MRARVKIATARKLTRGGKKTNFVSFSLLPPRFGSPCSQRFSRAIAYLTRSTIPNENKGLLVVYSGSLTQVKIEKKTKSVAKGF